MNNIVVSIWGIGPTYRQRIIHTITKAINTGYDNILPYVILTDKPEDFYELQDKTKKIVDVVNIHEVRENLNSWSREYEWIPASLDEMNYSIEYRRNTTELYKRFSNALHRFSLPRISELGYNRFLISDNDVDIRYDKIVSGEVTEEIFWNQFDIPVNTMKGNDLQTWTIPNSISWNDDRNIIMGNILRFALIEKFPEYEKNGINSKSPIPFFFKDYHTQTECGFRYYHLHDSKMTSKYFELWDYAMKICFKHSEFREQLTIGGGYIIIDNTPISAVNDVLNIKPINFSHDWYRVNIYRSDRFFFPKGASYNVNGRELSLQAANTLEEFNDINKELIEYLKSKNDWD